MSVVFGLGTRLRVRMRTKFENGVLHNEQQPEEVGHAYGRARNAVSRMVSKHCKISVATALEVRFCTCPVAGTRSCRSIILGSRIVEMEPYCSFVSVALGSQNFAARAS